MAAMKVYEYEVNGVKHTAQMTEEDAERLGGKEVKAGSAPKTKAAPAPANKAATA
ncbi:hypothetical protein SEA_UPYO_6 [Gordonia phage Upyo]|nr:hypothetical protein SEA_UPYO_6 [Gordonia phage Upyo]